MPRVVWASFMACGLFAGSSTGKNINLHQPRFMAVVFISHVLQEVLAVADRVVVLRKGVKVGDLATEEADVDLIVKLMVGTEEVGCAR